VKTDGLLDVKDVAEFLGLAVGTVYHLVSQRRIPVVRLSPRCLKFRRSEIEAWIESKSETEKKRVLDD
jgi:excisionase family DNA binding protein